jgi:hypothetical protein
MSELSVPRERYEAIAAEIASDTSPVGIDAAKTHVIIIHKLEQIERRLVRLEHRLNGERP